MDIVFFLKAGFMGFALSLGVLMLVFFVAGRMLRVDQRNFLRVFVLAGVVSFLVMDVFLYYKVSVSLIHDPQVFLAACVGGWLSGILSGLTTVKNMLLGLARR
jgi:hypothetical protein